MFHAVKLVIVYLFWNDHGICSTCKSNIVVVSIFWKNISNCVQCQWYLQNTNTYDITLRCCVLSIFIMAQKSRRTWSINNRFQTKLVKFYVSKDEIQAMLSLIAWRSIQKPFIFTPRSHYIVLVCTMLQSLLVLQWMKWWVGKHELFG